MNDYQRFGDFIKRKRNEREVPVRPMAELVGLSAGYYGDIESGRRCPVDREILDSIIDVLKFNDEDKLFFMIYGVRHVRHHPRT